MFNGRDIKTIIDTTESSTAPVRFRVDFDADDGTFDVYGEIERTGQGTWWMTVSLLEAIRYMHDMISPEVSRDFSITPYKVMIDTNFRMIMEGYRKEWFGMVWAANPHASNELSTNDQMMISMKDYGQYIA